MRNKNFTKLASVSAVVVILTCLPLLGQSLLYTGEYIIINFDTSRPVPSDFVYKEIEGAKNQYARIAGHDWPSDYAHDCVVSLTVSGDARVLYDGILLSPTNGLGKLWISFGFSPKEVVYCIEVFYEHRGFLRGLLGAALFEADVTINYGKRWETSLPHDEDHLVLMPQQNLIISGREFVAHSAGAFGIALNSITFEAHGLEEVLIKEIRLHLSPPYRGIRRP